MRPCAGILPSSGEKSASDQHKTPSLITASSLIISARSTISLSTSSLHHLAKSISFLPAFYSFFLSSNYVCEAVNRCKQVLVEIIVKLKLLQNTRQRFRQLMECEYCRPSMSNPNPNPNPGLCDSDVSVCPSVRLSVRHTPVLCLAERKQDREMYTI